MNQRKIKNMIVTKKMVRKELTKLKKAIKEVIKEVSG